MSPQHDAYALEAAHEPDTDPAWQESWYFNFSDADAGVYGLARIAVRPAKNRADGLFLASVGGRRAVLYPFLGVPVKAPFVEVRAPEIIRVGGLRLSCENTMRTWRTRLETRGVRADLVHEAFTPMYMFPEPSAGDGASAAANHYEQACRVTGVLSLRGREVAVNGLGQRDHSWGPRNWAGVGEWRWISAQFPSGWAFNLWSVGAGPETRLLGFVGDRDGVWPLEGGRVRWLGDPSGRSPEGAEMELLAGERGTRMVSMSVDSGWPLYKEGAAIFEGFGPFTCEGETGSGVVEHLWRTPLRGLTMLPMVAPYASATLRTVL
ncbi:MAG: hypothetical protein ACLFOY_18215 [Desulfatibacillaceae bacterium]